MIQCRGLFTFEMFQLTKMLSELRYSKYSRVQQMNHCKLCPDVNKQERIEDWLNPVKRQNSLRTILNRDITKMLCNNFVYTLLRNLNGKKEVIEERPNLFN